jgi:hypothetical protein
MEHVTVQTIATVTKDMLEKIAKACSYHGTCEGVDMCKFGVNVYYKTADGSTKIHCIR